MMRRAAIAALALLWGGATFLLADANIPSVYRWRPGADASALPPNQTIPLFPDLSPTVTLRDAAAKDGKAGPLKPESRLALVRYIHGEFARAVRPLPSVKKGYRIKAGAPLDEKAVKAASRIAAASPGDTVQITRLEFRAKEVVVDINGGSGGEKKRWRDRISVSVGGASPPVRTSSTSDQPSATAYRRAGATLILEFDGPVPDMTPDEFKHFLAAYLDFSKQRSATVQWVETLPPEFQQAIKDKRAAVGMDREMVVAAIGRPEQKIRERDADGMETEDWIYGHPPAKTIFVKFAGDKVIAVREYPH